MDAIVAVRPHRSAGWGRIHRRFYSFSTGGRKPVLHRAGVENCTRGIRPVKSAISGVGTDLLLLLAPALQNRGWSMTRSMSKSKKRESISVLQQPVGLAS